MSVGKARRLKPRGEMLASIEQSMNVGDARISTGASAISIPRPAAGVELH